VVLKLDFFHNRPPVDRSRIFTGYRKASSSDDTVVCMRNSGDSTSDTGSMLTRSILLIRPVICSWRLSEPGRCGPTLKELSVCCCRRGDELMVSGCTARTWVISPLIDPPTHASGLAKGAMAVGGRNNRRLVMSRLVTSGVASQMVYGIAFFSSCVAGSM